MGDPKVTRRAKLRRNDTEPCRLREGEEAADSSPDVTGNTKRPRELLGGGGGACGDGTHGGGMAEGNSSSRRCFLLRRSGPNSGALWLPFLGRRRRRACARGWHGEHGNGGTGTYGAPGARALPQGGGFTRGKRARDRAAFFGAHRVVFGDVSCRTASTEHPAPFSVH